MTRTPMTGAGWTTRCSALVAGVMLLCSPATAGVDFVLGELGSNDVRLSTMGPDGDFGFFANSPDIAYNPVDNEYLVVWAGTETGSQFTTGIYGQRLDGTTGAEIGTDDFLISSLTWDAGDPHVRYNPVDHEYFLIYVTGISSDDTIGVYGQRLDATGATPVGPTEFRVSQTDGEGFVFRWAPDLVYNPNDHEFFVVWDAFGVYGQRLDPAGNELGGDITYSTEFNDSSPALEHNPVENEYLMAWQRYEDLDVRANGWEPQIDLDWEIYGVRIDPATGGELGTGRFQISEMGPGGPFDENPALSPDVVYNPADHEYLVTWQGDLGGGFDLNAFGQRLDASTGAQIGVNDFQFSNVGGSCCRSIRDLRTIWDPVRLGYLTVWGSDATVNEEWETYIQRLDRDGDEVGLDDHRVSNMGPEGNNDFRAVEQVLAYNSVDDQFLTVWTGNITFSLTSFVGEDDIWGQRLGNLVGAVSVRASAVGGPVSIPAEGGSFDARLRARNETPTEQAIDGWFEVRSQDGTFSINSQVLPLQLDASGTLDVTRTVAIPAEAPAGLYRFTFFVGVDPLASAQSSFRLRKLQ